MQRTVNLHGTPIEEVKSFCYLGNHITQDNKYTTEIKRRIALAKPAFIKKSQINVFYVDNILDSERSEECIVFTMMFIFFLFCEHFFDQKECTDFYDRHLFF